MAELKIDIDGINNKVIPLLNKAKTELESAASSLSAISYSPDYYKFTNRSRVQSVLPQNIRNIKTDVNNINKWLSDISTKFKEADRKSNNSVNSLLGKLDKINLSNSIAKTGGAIVGVAAQSMAIGQDNITIFAQKGFELAETIVNGVQDGINFVGAKISSAWDSFYNAIVKPGINFFEECKAKVSNFVTGAVNEISKGINNIKDGITSFAQKGWDKLCGMAQSVGDAFNSVGAHISSAWNSFCTDVWPNIWDGIQSFGASVANVVTGFIKGLCQFVESLVDVVVILGTAIGSIGTGIYDGISYLVSLANGTSDEWESVTGAMWGNVMGFVAEDHVGNAFADFYKNNVVGQWLDEHAIDVCKSDGIVTNIFSGLGYVTGEVLLTIATLGVGTAVSAGATTLSFATTSAVVAGTSAFGKYTQEAWGEARDSSWEGIERLYEKGEITEEEYNTFTAIRSMTDEQWAEIEKDYKDGKISEEEFEQIKQIREMPEDWKTFENGWKGLLYGVANGVWEGVQWYVGGKLAGWTIKGGSQLASSTIRVGTDTIFNAVDTPFRAAMDTITYGETWDQAWEEQGGWQSVLTNIGIGLVGSTGGEIFDGVKLNKASKVLDANHAFDSLDETTAKKVKDALLDDHKAGKIDLSKITDNELNDAITKKLNLFDDTAKQSIKNTKATIKNKITNKFENVITRFKGSINKYFKESLEKNPELKNKAMNEGIMHFTTEENADKILSTGFIKKSPFHKRYGIEGVSYFFAGKPSIEQIAMNLDDVPNKIVAIKSKPGEEIANKLLYRYKDDNALMWKGEFKFKEMGLDAEKVYYVLDNTNGNLQYVEVSKEIYDNFNKNVLPYKGQSKDYAKEIANKYQKDLVEKATKSKVISTDKIMDSTRVKGFDEAKLNKISKVLDESTAKKVKVNLNEINLKNEILSKTTNIEDETLIAKSLYEELNKKVHYDFGYKYGGDIKKQKIINNKVNFSNINKNSSVVCKGWSELYEELLKEKGINCEVVKATDANHWWVQIYTKDGKTIVADATDVIDGKVDLVNSKIGSQTNGFFTIDDTQIGQRPKEIIKTQEQIDQITEIDKQLGYADKNGYRIDKMSDANKMFKSNIFEKFKKTSQYKKSLELLEIPEGIDGYEAYGYFLQLQKTNKDIRTQILFMKKGDEIEPLCYTSYINSDPPIYQIYGKTMSKVTFTNLQDVNEYINTLDIIKK